MNVVSSVEVSRSRGSLRHTSGRNMLRLFLFDLARLIRPGRRFVYLGYVEGLGRLPGEARTDLGLRGDLILTRASNETSRHLAARRARDKQKLLEVLSAIATRRGFPPLAWDERDVS